MFCFEFPRCVEEVLPPVLDSTSDQPPLFDGTTRFFHFHSVFFSDHLLIPCLVGNKLKSCKRKEHKRKFFCFNDWDTEWSAQLSVVILFDWVNYIFFSGPLDFIYWVFLATKQRAAGDLSFFKIWISLRVYKNGFVSWRLYISYSCPFAQRVWITRNYKVGWFSWFPCKLCFCCF